jgi:hypothetical protein
MERGTGPIGRPLGVDAPVGEGAFHSYGVLLPR